MARGTSPRTPTLSTWENKGEPSWTRAPKHASTGEHRATVEAAHYESACTPGRTSHRRDLYLKRTIAAGPSALDATEDVRKDLISQVEAGRHPRTNATVSKLIDEHLKSAELELRVKQTLQGYARKHIHSRPIGGRARSEGDAQDVQALESFYAELRRCRDRCDGRTTVFHYTSDEHKCTKRCRRHACEPQATNSSGAAAALAGVRSP
jgi:hypothetical protein